MFNRLLRMVSSAFQTVRSLIVCLSPAQRPDVYRGVSREPPIGTFAGAGPPSLGGGWLSHSLDCRQRFGGEWCRVYLSCFHLDQRSPISDRTPPVAYTSSARSEHTIGVFRGTFRGSFAGWTVFCPVPPFQPFRTHRTRSLGIRAARQSNIGVRLLIMWHQACRPVDSCCSRSREERDWVQKPPFRTLGRDAGNVDVSLRPVIHFSISCKNERWVLADGA